MVQATGLEPVTVRFDNTRNACFRALYGEYVFTAHGILR